MASSSGASPPPSGSETCARVSVGAPASVIFIKGTWFPTHFFLSITDGLHSWTCQATEQAVADRAAGWDESVSEYIQRAKFHLSHQHPESIYSFLVDGDNHKLSWTMEKHGTKLEGKWKCEKAKNEQQTNCEILNFLMDGNIKLSDEVLRKTQSFERMKDEAEKCLKQSENFKNEKQHFETDVFRKFVAVLNSKKEKLRELREKLARLEPTHGTSENKENDLEDDTENEEDEGDEDETNSIESDDKGDKPSATEPLEAKLANELPAQTKVPSVHSPSKVHFPGTNEVQSGINVASSSGEALDSAAALLADSVYTSVPKRRRHR